MAPRHSQFSFVSTITGLGSIVADDARQRGLAPTRIENDGRADIVTFAGLDWTQLAGLRTAEAVYVGIQRLVLRRTARETARQLSAEAVGRSRIRLVVRLRDEQRFTRTALRNEFARQLAPIVAPRGPAAELWIVQTSPKALLAGIRVPTAPGVVLRRTVERPAALRPAVAAAMVHVAGRLGTILDPCCGTGTIPIEAIHAGAVAIGGDIDPTAVAAARANGAPSVVGLDARRLPFADDGFSAVVTNLPFGRQHLVQGAPVAWYRRVLSEALRVAPHVVVLAAPTTPFRQALGRLDVRLRARHDLDLLGNRTAMWVADRR